MIFIARAPGREKVGFTMNRPLRQLLLRWAILALGVMLATRLVSGIRCNDPFTLIAVVLLLSFFNAILRPLLVLFTLPFILVTMGMGIVVINAFLFLLVGRLVDGFYVAGFWSALGGSLVVSLTNFVVSALVRSSAGSTKRAKSKPDDVIDI
jgi:putative membrane protein